ncbi:hypothetical protein NA57DRAFT_53439 [Rhizodiscina lignyota]|uniref:Uncharacterized protein n=1 Tax=Rhizodiscina lignyota TaxID=1504668 RepID=A0A9P4M8C7_9PEZI|nr:hypothetical protein NA57DRAFT_53439 [Rhizodiscina lignyota]
MARQNPNLARYCQTPHGGDWRNFSHTSTSNRQRGAEQHEPIKTLLVLANQSSANCPTIQHAAPSVRKVTEEVLKAYIHIDLTRPLRNERARIKVRHVTPTISPPTRTTQYEGDKRVPRHQDTSPRAKYANATKIHDLGQTAIRLDSEAGKSTTSLPPERPELTSIWARLTILTPWLLRRTFNLAVRVVFASNSPRMTPPSPAAPGFGGPIPGAAPTTASYSDDLKLIERTT